MKYGTQSMAAATLAALLLTGCGEPANDEGAAESAAVPGVQPDAQTVAEHLAQGTLNSVDRTAGMVNISHEAVASAGWPAMTMSFKLADPSAAANLTPGQRVDFRFTTEGGGTVTQITAAE